MYRVLMFCWGMAGANFFYQAMTTRDWEKAFDRSFFQTAAILGWHWMM
jgi:hypothetical protein